MSHAERGSTAVTIVLLTPTVIVLMLFTVFVGRLAATENDVRGAARDAARAASFRGTTNGATQAAVSTARATLEARDVSCATLDVTTVVDNEAIAPLVRVTLRCSVTAQDLTGLNVPGTRTVTAVAAEPLDIHRGARS